MYARMLRRCSWCGGTGREGELRIDIYQAGSMELDGRKGSIKQAIGKGRDSEFG